MRHPRWRSKHENMLDESQYLFQDIARLMNEDPKALRLVAKGVEFSARDDGRTAREAKLVDGDVIHVQVRQIPATEGSGKVASGVHGIHKDAIPHYILSRDYFGRLFQLLGGPSSIASQVRPAGVWERLLAPSDVQMNASRCSHVHALRYVGRL